eukprot:12913005-Prorocentrum_lima.AAC.1
MQPPWLTLCSPSGDVQTHLDNPLCKGSYDNKWIQCFESGGSKIQSWQLRSRLQGNYIIPGSSST